MGEGRSQIGRETTTVADLRKAIAILDDNIQVMVRDPNDEYNLLEVVELSLLYKKAHDGSEPIFLLIL